MQWIFSILTDNPAIRAMQLVLLALAIVAIYMVFFTTRDILLRTKSFAYQFGCIVLTAVLPILGFFIYLLIRPSTTLKQRETDKMLRQLLHEKHA
jgi:uncharacterized membrane protein YobD (UPF0266 family)